MADTKQHEPEPEVFVVTRGFRYQGVGFRKGHTVSREWLNRHFKGDTTGRFKPLVIDFDVPVMAGRKAQS